MKKSKNLSLRSIQVEFFLPSFFSRFNMSRCTNPISASCFQERERPDDRNQADVSSGWQSRRYYSVLGSPLGCQIKSQLEVLFKFLEERLDFSAINIEHYYGLGLKVELVTQKYHNFNFQWILVGDLSCLHGLLIDHLAR